MFLPALFLFAHFVSAPVAVSLGLLFVVGRVLYFRSYVADPSSRTVGFLMGLVANGLLLLGAAGGALWAALGAAPS